LFKVKGFLIMLFVFSFVLFVGNVANASIFSKIFGSNDTSTNSTQAQNATPSNSAEADFQKWNNEVDSLLNSLKTTNQTNTSSSSETGSTNVKPNSSVTSSSPNIHQTTTSNTKDEVQQGLPAKASESSNAVQAQNSSLSSSANLPSGASCIKITDGEYPPVNLLKNQFIDSVKLFNDGTKTILLLESTTPFTQADIKQYAFPDQVIIDIPNIFLSQSVKTGQFTPQGINYVTMVRIQNFDSDILKSSRIVLTFPDTPKYTVLKTDDPKKLEIAFEVPSLENTLKDKAKTGQEENVKILDTSKTTASNGKN
jgi:hypothetical protein